MTPLDTLNAVTPDEFAAALDGVFEHAPWVPRAAALARPFATVSALHAALMDVVRLADAQAQRGFLSGHPALSAAAIAPSLTADSAAEQAALGLAGLGTNAARFTELSAAYEARHGFPFIICARRHTPSSVLHILARRLAASEADERAAALGEIFFISRLRLVARVTGPGMPETTGEISAHVVAAGRASPVAGVRVALFRDSTRLLEGMTGLDGVVLLAGEPLRIGPHALHFHLGGDFAGSAAAGAGVPWYEVVPVQFHVAEPEGRYGFTVLAAPDQYTVIRGR